jgi:farnesol dehydrogenase
MKVFLTGGSGYLGQALLRRLLDEGHQVTAFARRPVEGLEHSRLEWHRGDLREGPPPAELVHRHRAVIHTAALVKNWVRDPAEFDRVNVQAWDELLAVCDRVGIQKIVHTSSFMSLGPSPPGQPLRETDRAPRDHYRNEYERTKHLADEVTDRWAAKGTPIVTLYPGVIYGPGALTEGNLVGKMIWMISKRTFPGLFGTGHQVWNLTYLPDVVAGHLLALERALPGRAYILGGENVALNDLVTAIHERLGRRGSGRHLPISWAEALGSWMERQARISGRPPLLTRGVASVYRHDWAYDSSAAEQDLGYRRTPWTEALAATVEWARRIKRWE